MRLDEQTIERLKSEHLETSLHEVNISSIDQYLVIRPPTKVEYKRFFDTASKDTRRLAALENLTIDCTVWPARDDLNVLLETYPGIPASVGGRILELAGIEEESTSRKL